MSESKTKPVVRMPDVDLSLTDYVLRTLDFWMDHKGRDSGPLDVWPMDLEFLRQEVEKLRQLHVDTEATLDRAGCVVQRSKGIRW